MGLLATIRQLVRSFRGAERRRLDSDEFRRCRFESMEPRRLLAADPIRLGAVYIEEDGGADLHGDTFEITFVGGASQTELAQLVINGDRGTPGFGNQDVFFDTQEGGLGADHGVPFEIVSLQTANPNATVTASVTDGTSLLTLDFSGFHAGDKLVFSIDVDEVEDYDPLVTDLERQNEGIDPITSGVEFQASRMTAYFRADHYHDTNGSAEFRNVYDPILAGTSLNLSADNFQGKRDRSAGGMVGLQQVPLPIAISGRVYLEKDLDLVQDSGEPGIEGVELELWQKGAEGFTFTGHSTTTDGAGNYEFGTELNLLPGTYQVRESQPDGLFSVGAIPGTVDGTRSGSIVPNSHDVLTEISIPLGGQHSIHNDFAEAEPVSISGHVYHDRSNDGLLNPGEELLSNVTIQVIPLSTIAPQDTVTLHTDSDGFYEATGLAPGRYRIVQTVQPAGFFDGLDTPGTVAGAPVGTVSNPGDSLEGIQLAGGQAGINYNFGELAPASLRGRVGLTDRDGNCDSADWRSITGAVVRLLNARGELVAETTTDELGEYEFTELHPGQYSVVELTPDGLIDADAHAGSVGGNARGTAGVGAIRAITLGSGEAGIGYDFCEHEPASISGHVYHDENNNGELDEGESPIPNAEVVLLNAAGRRTVQRTDSAGYYAFAGLDAGTYTVIETQPTGWLDGLDAAGVVDGTTVGTARNPGDRITGVSVKWGDDSTQNNFGELLTGSIAGQVHLDLNGNCVLDEGEQTLEGVLIELLDADGGVLATTRTDADGRYLFSDLAPGTYGIHEVQPDAIFQGGQTAGSHGGFDVFDDFITEIAVGSGQDLVHYDFCEIPPASVSGMVFADFNQDCKFNGSDRALSGVMIELLDAEGQVLATTRTDADGRYSFSDLAPGTYGIHEVQPDGIFHGGQTAGSNGGFDVFDDFITQIEVGPGQDLVHYDFCEIPPASVSGMVFADLNQDCKFNGSDRALSGVTIELLDAEGQVLATTRTDADGRYSFSDLAPGTYGIHEIQPRGIFHGGQTAGSNGGLDLFDDFITQIDIGPGQDLVNYDFCEVPPATLSGMVFVDPNQDCEFNGSDAALSGVTIELLDAFDSVIATTTTNSLGQYRFENLEPGIYSVRELQPVDYFSAGQVPGSGGADNVDNNLISTVLVAAGDDLTAYNFCELPPARISGNVFQDGATISVKDKLEPQQIGKLRDGLLTPDDVRLAGVTLHLRDGFTGEAIDASEALPGRYAPGPISAVTNANGYYEFTGIPGGRAYAVYQIHPTDYVDSIDTVGTTTGFAFNPQRTVEGQFVLEPLAGQPADDAIIRIAVTPGQSSVNNNFSEVRVQILPPDPPPVIPPITPPPPVLFPPPPTTIPRVLDLGTPMSTRTVPVQSLVSWIAPRQNVMVETFAGSIGYSWHLSVINGGMPRDMASASSVDDAVWRNATYLDRTNWTAESMQEASWVISGDQTTATPGSRRVVFGLRGSIPFTGDFNGDGKSEIGIFYRGEWFVDLNGNGAWDDGDLWARLGDELDRPVVGDWDGDGKDDIGIFGPEWLGDQRQIDKESGLPDSNNLVTVEIDTRPKNVPPVQDEATDGQRLIRLNAQGPRRADVIDHVFRYGTEADAPVAGDWNGDGIRSIGVFRSGEWVMDTNGDGRADERDRSFRFGHPGDIPVIGDWDGNGVEEIGIYRSGQWILDVNGNRELDAHDKIFEMGGAADRPVVGDWNGDGIDEPGLYRETAAPTEVPVSNVKL